MCREHDSKNCGTPWLDEIIRNRRKTQLFETVFYFKKHLYESNLGSSFELLQLFANYWSELFELETKLTKRS